MPPPRLDPESPHDAETGGDMSVTTAQGQMIEVVRGGGRARQLTELLCYSQSPTRATECQSICLLIAIGVWMMLVADSRSAGAWSMHAEFAPVWAWGLAYWTLGVSHAIAYVRKMMRARLVCSYIECVLWCLMAVSFARQDRWFVVALMVGVFSVSSGWVILKLRALRRSA